MGTYPKNMKSSKTIWLAALFSISRTWKQPQCPLTKDSVKKIHTMEYNILTKMDKMQTIFVKWRKFERIMSNKVCQDNKNKYCTIFVAENLIM